MYNVYFDTSRKFATYELRLVCCGRVSVRVTVFKITRVLFIHLGIVEVSSKTRVGMLCSTPFHVQIVCTCTNSVCSVFKYVLSAEFYFCICLLQHCCLKIAPFSHSRRSTPSLV